MKILHTSDWHLGRELKGRKRHAEFSALLDWLLETIEREKVEVLLLAGDVFDTNTPGNRSQALYYRFLCRAAGSKYCRDIVVIGGNHDSPTFLDAPRELLRELRVHVVGEARGTPEQELLLLRDDEGNPALIVGAVPYLHDRFVRSVVAGEEPDDKSRKVVDGIRRHYREVCRAAEEMRRSLEHPVPVVMMGHLLLSGSRAMAGDGVRPLYIGTLDAVEASIFPAETVDYAALGHLHVPQAVGGRENIRYSGSPLPMGFGEAGGRKSVVLVEFSGRKCEVRPLEIPVFQELVRLRGSMAEIGEAIAGLRSRDSSAWLDICCDEPGFSGDLNAETARLLDGSSMEVLVLRNEALAKQLPMAFRPDETLEALDETEVFRRLLAEREITAEERPALCAAYAEILHELRQHDRNAEQETV